MEKKDCERFKKRNAHLCRQEYLQIHLQKKSRASRVCTEWQDQQMEKEVSHPKGIFSFSLKIYYEVSKDKYNSRFNISY